VKRLWVWFQSLPRARQIGIAVLAAHGIAILMLAANHLSAPTLKPRKAFAIRTALVPKPAPVVRKDRSTKIPATTAPTVEEKKNKSPLSRKTEAKKGSPVPQKKGGASRVANPEVDTHLLQQIAESLEAISDTPMSTQSHFSFSLPPAVEIQDDGQAFFDRPAYGEAVTAALQNSLVLPEYGSVIAQIEIGSNGTVRRCEILEARSRKNSEFLKKRLQELAFPCLNEFGISDDRVVFTITFQNVENR